MKGYKLEKLGDVCDFIGGSQPPKSTFIYDLSEVDKNKYVRLIQIRDYKSDKHIVYILKSKTKKFCARDDVMIGRYGPPVFQILKGLDGAYNVALMKAVPKTDKLDKDYLFKFLESPDVQKYIVGLSERAAGQTGVNKQALHNYPIYIPPRLEQKRIVAILDQSFVDIEQVRAHAQQNLNNSRELFESCLYNRLLAVCSNAPIQTLSCVTELIVDCEHKTAPTQDEGFPSIRTPNIGKGELILNNVKRVSKETYDLWTKRAIPKPGDLILAREAPAGNIGVIPKGEQVCLGQRTVLIRPLVGIVNSRYLAFLLLHPIMQDRLLAYSTGATVQHVNMKDIRQLAISELPKINEQLVDVDILLKLKYQVAQLEQVYIDKLKTLDELKKSILQKAFTGELTSNKNKGAVA